MNAFAGIIRSKTMWAAVVTAILPFISQPVQDWITLHPGPYAAAAASLMAALRFFTNQSIPEKGAEAVAKKEVAAENQAPVPPTPPEIPK